MYLLRPATRAADGHLEELSGDPILGALIASLEGWTVELPESGGVWAPGSRAVNTPT